MNRQSEVTAGIDVNARLMALEAELAPSITEALEPVQADTSFKVKLEEELVAEAKKRAERQHLIRTFGLIGGGLLTVVAGIVGVILLKRQNHEEEKGEGPGQAAPATAPVG
jgi:hypothetical protein